MKLSTNILKLIEALQVLPGIGPKSAKRMALFLLTSDTNKALNISDALKTSISTIQQCEKCYVLNENKICDICSSAERDNKIMCVVETTSDLYSIEETGEYKGKYFVLNGLLSPIDNIGTEELKIKKLLLLIKDRNVSEVILALNTTLEGEATSYYILDKLKEDNLKITRIAQGVPAGGDLNYVDNATLRRALSYRTEIK
mgnify:FL=1